LANRVFDKNYLKKLIHGKFIMRNNVWIRSYFPAIAIEINTEQETLAKSIKNAWIVNAFLENVYLRLQTI